MAVGSMQSVNVQGVPCRIHHSFNPYVEVGGLDWPKSLHYTLALSRADRKYEDVLAKIQASPEFGACVAFAAEETGCARRIPIRLAELLPFGGEVTGDSSNDAEGDKAATPPSEGVKAGSRVIVTDLVTRRELNGTHAIVLALDADQGRVGVQLHHGEEWFLAPAQLTLVPPKGSNPFGDRADEVALPSLLCLPDEILGLVLAALQRDEARHSRRTNSIHRYRSFLSTARGLSMLPLSLPSYRPWPRGLSILPLSLPTCRPWSRLARPLRAVFSLRWCHVAGTPAAGGMRSWALRASACAFARPP